MNYTIEERVRLERGASILADLALLMASLFLAYLGFPVYRTWIHWGAPIPLGSFSEYLWMYLIYAPTLVGLLDSRGLYRFVLRPWRPLVIETTRVVFLAFVFLLFIGFLVHAQYISRLLVAVLGFLSLVLLLGKQLLVQGIIGRQYARGLNLPTILIIGSKKRAEEAIRLIQEDGHVPYRVFGCLDPDPSRVGLRILGVEVLGTIDQYEALLFNQPIDEVLIAMPPPLLPHLGEMLFCAEEVGRTVRIFPDFQIYRYQKHIPSTSTRLENLGGVPMLTLAPTRHPLDDLFVKRTLDILVSATALVLLSPLYMVIAALIKLTSPGPVFYPWRVMKMNGREFLGYKFRTMVVGAEKLERDLWEYNEMRGPVFKMTNDPRVTSIGRMLRRYSLDELPQLYSVLKGDMSLVGPRPNTRNEVANFDVWQRRKLSVKPGLTGLWAVLGRSKIKSFDDRVKLDLEYIDRWSLTLDLKILLRTIPEVIKGSGV